MDMRICETRHVDCFPPGDGFEGTSISSVDGRAEFKLEGESYTLIREKDEEWAPANYCEIRRDDESVAGFGCESFPTDIVTGDVDGNGTEDLIVENDDGLHVEYLTAEWWEPLCDDDAERVEEEFRLMMDSKLPMWERRKAAQALFYSYDIEHMAITNFFIELSEKPDFYPDEMFYAAEYFEHVDMIEKAFNIYLSLAKDTDLARYHRQSAKASACRLIGVTLE